MRKHESRFLANGCMYSVIVDWVDVETGLYKKQTYMNNGSDNSIYVDSNNYLHNLHGRAMTIDDVHYIHGRYYNKKEWLIEREVLLLEDNREEILNQI